MITYNLDGSINKLIWENDLEIKFRQDEYSGPSVFIWTKEDSEPIKVKFHPAIGSLKGTYNNLLFDMHYEESNYQLELTLFVQNHSDHDFTPKRLELRLGIDTYMEKFPDWDNRFFPTMIRCESTHAWGYMRSPKGSLLALASKDPIASWHHSYSRAYYDPVYSDTGHRIYTTSLDLLNEGPLPIRHPQSLSCIPARESKIFRILLAHVETEEELLPTLEHYIGMASIKMDKYTYELGEQATATSFGALTFKAPSGKVYTDTTCVTLDEYGIWQVLSSHQDKINEALIYVRLPWSYYLDEARKAALTYKQKATTHTESWYGFFSAFLARKYHPQPELDEALEQKFEEIYQVMLHEDIPVEAALPGRIQNWAQMIGLLVDAYEATGNLIYLDRADKLASHVMKHQSDDGAYRCGYGVHYTCVIYIAKAMLELYLAEISRAEPIYKERALIHYESAKCAIDDLEKFKDNIQTEGEMTFEDGMISCSSLQLGMFALIQQEQVPDDHVDPTPYIQAARYMLDKHRCLELTQIPDCRMRGATLRFWESMYDVMILQGLMTSPHGWTSWKNYATYYLYRLTGEKCYLTDLMDTLGACMQVIDYQTGKLRWAFATDPYIEADVFVPDEMRPGKGKMVKQVIGEQYIDMVSDWWHTDPAIVSMGYAYPDRNMTDGIYQGGACDNDVHEHFKCLEEVALTKSYIHQEDDELLHYNCKISLTDNHLTITPSEALVNEVIIRLETSLTLHIPEWNRTLELLPGLYTIQK